MTSTNIEKRKFDQPTVLVVRHGRTRFNSSDPDKDKLKGTRFDLPLTDEGFAKGRKDAAAIAPYAVAKVYHSPMLRAKQTAREIAGARESIEGLKPWDVGYLSGQARVTARDRIEYYIRHPFRAIPEGDAYRDFWNEVTAAVSKILKEAVDADGALVIVTHSCNVLAIDAYLDGGTPRAHIEGEMPPPGAILILQKHGGKWRMNEWKQ